MVTPISSVSAASQVSAAQNNPSPKAPSTPPSQPQDSVHLSAAAVAKSGDADHDGDSH